MFFKKIKSIGSVCGVVLACCCCFIGYCGLCRRGVAEEEAVDKGTKRLLTRKRYKLKRQDIKIEEKLFTQPPPTKIFLAQQIVPRFSILRLVTRPFRPLFTKIVSPPPATPLTLITRPPQFVQATSITPNTHPVFISSTPTTPSNVIYLPQSRQQQPNSAPIVSPHHSATVLLFF